MYEEIIVHGKKIKYKKSISPEETGKSIPREELEEISDLEKTEEDIENE